MLRVVFFAAAIFSTISIAIADDVSHEPPRIYTERIAPNLTPGAEILRHIDDFAKNDEPAVVLLYETVRWVADDGHSCVAIHEIDVARDDQGATRIAKQVIPFRKSSQKVHLVLARSVLPDGTSQSVSPTATFIQSPQYEGDASLYSDSGELVILYPSVRAGTARESIVVIDETASRMPGEFAGELYFASWWPQMKIRHVVELEGRIAGRLSITPLGTGTPAPQREEIVGGGVRFTWQRDRVPKTDWEPQRAPIDQVGPVAYLSTLKNWDAFGAWYTNLLKGRDQVRDKLAAEVATKTKGLGGQDAIVAALLKDAAGEVRYTGLEFGVAGLQPYDPNEVWANRYGDCKDKANLLRVMLREKKVPAYLAFVNTEYAGLIEKRSPSYRQFNHVMVAVAQPDGAYVFCDPTIEHARPGMLRPDDVDREVMLLRDGATEFVRTPRQDIGTTRYAFDLKLAQDGGMSGWLTLDATGYWGASFVNYLSGKDRQQARSRTLSLVQNFYRAAELIDLESMPAADFAGTYRLKAYFTVRGPGSTGRTRDTLEFPGAERFLPQFGDHKNRETDFWQSRGTHEISARIQLPSGWSAIDPPMPFQVESAPAIARAAWASDGSVVTATLHYQTLENDVPLEQYPLIYNAVSSLRSWLGKPLSIGAGNGDTRVATTMPATQPALTDFPLMPSGEGQLQLVERRFPAGSDAALRREALLKVLQWFPEDKTARFAANVRLLAMDRTARAKDPAFVGKLRQLLDDSAEGLYPDYRGWGKYVLSEWLAESGRKSDAVNLLTEVAHDPSMTAYRRAWSAVAAERLLKGDDSGKAVSLLKESLDWDSEVLPIQYADLAELLLKAGQADELLARLQSLAQRAPQLADKVASALGGEVNRYLTLDQRQPAIQLLSVLEKLIAQNPGMTHLQGDLAASRERIASFAGYAGVANSLEQYLKAHRPAWWDSTPTDPSLQTPEQFREAFKRIGLGPALEPYVRCGLEYATRFPEAPDFSQTLWQLASLLQQRRQEQPLLDELLSCLDRMPASDRWYHEGKVLQAQEASNKGDDAAAIRMLQAVAEDPRAGIAIQYGAIRKCGEIFEHGKKYAEALAMYRRLETNLAANRRSSSALLRAALINLESGDRAEALRICGVLSHIDPKDIEAGSDAAQIRELLALTADPNVAQQFWKNQEKWWPLWTKSEELLGLPALDGQVIVPVIPDPVELGRELGQATRANDRERFFKAYRTLVHAARWEPSFLVAWSGVVSIAIRVAPERAEDFRAVIIAALKDLDTPDRKVSAGARIMLCAFLIDSRQNAEALNVVHKYIELYPTNDAGLEAIHRLWSMAGVSLPKELDAAITAMEKDLAGVIAGGDRARTVLSLADAYHARGRSADELHLLKTEISNPLIQGDNVNGPLIQNRYSALTKKTVDPSAFNDAIAQWINEHKPAWYDYARPKSLKDFAGRDIDQTLRQPPGDMLTAEFVKFALLVAQDPGQSYSRRADAFERASNTLAALCGRHDELQDLYASFYNLKGIPDPMKRYWLWMASLDRVANPEAQGPDLRLHPLAGGFTELQRRVLACQTALGAARDSAPALENLATDVLRHPLDSVMAEQFDTLFRRLVNLEAQAARRVYEKTDHLELADGVSETSAAMRFRWLRLLRARENVVRADDAAAALMLPRLAGTPVPADWRQYRVPFRPERVDQKHALGVEYQMLKMREFTPGDTEFWMKLLAAATLPKGDPELAGKLFDALLSNMPDDEGRSRVAIAADWCFDLDDSMQRERMFNSLQPYADPTNNPVTSAVIRLLKVRVALRMGQPVDFDIAFGDPKHAPNAAIQVQLKLTYYLHAQDTASLKRVLEALSPEQLLAPRDFRQMLVALETAGMKEEEELVRDAADKELYRLVLRSWSDPDRSDAMEAIALANSMNAAGKIPPKWLADLPKWVGDEELRGRIEMGTCELNRDWAGVVAAADKLLARNPNVYQDYWTKGNALFQLGRRDEAAKALKTFVQYCNDCEEQPRAMGILKQLETKQ